MKRVIYALVILLSLLSLNAYAYTVDKLVAYIDEIAITSRELDNAHAEWVTQSLKRSRTQTLEALINTTLILREARRLRLIAPDDSSLIHQYLDLKVRALIFVREVEVKGYYDDNIDKFVGITYEEASAEIRRYLTELNYNEKLRQHMQSLRDNAHIRILLPPQD